MGADLTLDRSQLQGLLIQDDRLTAAAIDLSIADPATRATQAGPLPGHPIAQQDTDAVLDAIGSQSADKQLRIQTQRAGHPGTEEASFLFKEEGDALWTGWDAPMSISDFEYIKVTDTSNAWRYPDADTTDAGRIIVVAQDGDQKVSAWSRDPATAIWASAEIHDKGSTYGDGAHPAVLVLPSGRIKTWFWRPVGNSAQIRMHYSDDEGATWVVGQLECLDEPIDTTTYTLGRIRVAHLGGQLVLICEITSSGDQQLWQYASADLGCTFTKISETSGGASRVAPVLLTMPDRIVVAYISVGSREQPFVRVLGSAGDPLASADATNIGVGITEWATRSGSTFTNRELAGYVDGDGCMWLFGLNYRANGGGGASRQGVLLRSTDRGETWTAPGDSSAANVEGAAWWHSHDAVTYPDDFCAVAWRSMGVIVHGAQAGQVIHYDRSESLMATFLGGMTRVCHPEYTTLGAHESVNRASWEYTWLPWIAPDELPFWTQNMIGATPLSHDAEGRGVTHDNLLDRYYWTGVPTTSVSKGFILRSGIIISDGPAMQVNHIARVGDTLIQQYEVRVSVTQSSIVLQDANGPLINTIATDAGALGCQIKIALAGADVHAWYRIRGTDTAWQQWVLIGSTDSLVNGGAGASHYIEVGTVVGALGKASFRLLCHSEDSFTGAQLAVGQSTLKLVGRTLMPTPVYVNDGLSIICSDGPTVRPDQWHIDTRYTYAATNLCPRRVPSPQLGHRTLDDSTDADIVWKLGESTADMHGLMGAFLALYLGEINWRLGEVWGRSGGVWSKLTDIDAASDTQLLGYQRNGSRILPTTSGLGINRYVLEHSLNGCIWDYGSGTPRRIRTNTSGTWPNASTGTTVLPRLQLESYAAGDPASGTGNIWSKDLVVLVPLDSSVEYDAIMLRIKAQTTPDGDLRTGIAMPGWLMGFGHPYAAGRAVGLSPNHETTEGRNGVRLVRQLGSSRPWVEYDWTDGVWSFDLTASPLSPDFIRTFSNGDPWATPAAVPWDMAGAYGRAQGAVDPIVYVAGVPLIPGPGSTPTIVTDRARHLYGRLVSESFRTDTAEGDEWSGERPEYVRVNTTRVEGEV